MEDSPASAQIGKVKNPIGGSDYREDAKFSETQGVEALGDLKMQFRVSEEMTGWEIAT